MGKETNHEKESIIVSPAFNAWEDKRSQNLLDLEKDYYKKKNTADWQIRVHNYKRFSKEQERQQKKTQFDRIDINIDGTVTATPINTCVDIGPHRVTNFLYPNLTRIRHLNNEKEVILLFECIINQENRFVLLDGKKIGNTKYLLEKLATIGVKILAPSDSCSRECVSSFMSTLLANFSKEKKLPTTHGWYFNSDGNLLFSKKGDETWDTLMKKL